MARLGTLALLGLLEIFGFARAQDDPPQLPSSCNEMTLTHPEIGSAYRGRVSNDDYHFSVQVPHGFTGWSGTGNSAPFHGFTIFLSSDNSACIVFKVRIRIEDVDVLHRPVDAKPLILGKATAWQTATKGNRNGVEFENVVTSFSFTQPDQIDDGTITLDTSGQDKVRDLRIYNEFLSSLKFGK